MAPSLPPRSATLLGLVPGLLLGTPGIGIAAAAEREAVVIDVSDDTPEHAHIARELRRAVRKHPGFLLKDIHGVLNAGDEEEEQTNIRTAQSFHDAGRKVLEQGDAEDAADQLSSALQLMRKSFALLPHVRHIKELLLRLGDARAQLGETEEADAVFRQAADFRADPESVTMSPAGRAAYARARADLEALDRGAITVTSDPPHAVIYVDGRFKGVTPTTVAGLTEGEHLAALYKPGYARVSAILTASSDGLGEVDFELEEARRKPLYDEMCERIGDEVAKVATEDATKGDQGIRQAGALLFSETAIVMHVGGKKHAKSVELFLFDTGTQRLLHKVSAGVDWTSRNREAIVALFDRLVDIDWAVALGASSSGPGGGPALTRQWWFWTAIGVGVAAAVVAVVVSTSGEGSPAPPTTGSLVLTF